jgi:hypothetical protein
VSRYSAGKGISAVEHPPYSPDLASADFCLFPELNSVNKGKHFWNVEDIKSSVGGKKFDTHSCSVFKKNVLNKSPSAGNTVKNWGEITLKNSMLLIYAALNMF